MEVHGIWFDDNGDMHLDPGLEEEILNLWLVFGDLFSKYNEATVISAMAESVTYDFLDKSRSKAFDEAVLGLKHAIHDFVKAHWGKHTEVFVSYAYSPFSGLKLFIVVFGIPSLVRKEELEKFLEADGVKLTRQLKKRAEELESLVAKLLLSKWLAERLEKLGCKDALESFKDGGITGIELYSVKDKKWVGKRPKDARGDDVVAYVVGRTLSPV